MKLFACALFDTKTGIFHAPLFFAHKALAVRAALALASDPGNTVGRYPYDYRLHCLGSFDDGTGTFSHSSEDAEDFGTVGALLAASGAQPRPVDPATATASEIIAARETGEL